MSLGEGCDLSVTLGRCDCALRLFMAACDDVTAGDDVARPAATTAACDTDDVNGEDEGFGDKDGGNTLDSGSCLLLVEPGDDKPSETNNTKYNICSFFSLCSHFLGKKLKIYSKGHVKMGRNMYKIVRSFIISSCLMINFSIEIFVCKG